MSTSLIIVLVVIAVLYFWYASIIAKRNDALSALSGIDVQLKKRANLIPNVLTIAKKFMEHEKSLLTEITELREQLVGQYDKKDADAIEQHFEVAESLSSKMGALSIKMENYPDLKSDQTMVQAMQTYNEVEAQISAARRFYNTSVSSLNTSIQIFPGSAIASFAGVKEMPFYEAPESAKAPVDAANYL